MKDSLGYTQEQLEDFHAQLQAKMAKAQKKKALKSKKEERSTIEASKRAAALELEAQRKAAEERLRKEQAELQARVKAQHALRQERLRRHREEQQRIDDHNKKVLVYQEELSKQQKKLKALRKKVRDIVELQEKIAGLKVADKNYKVTSEQQQKLDRLDALETEIEEVEEAEKDVLSTCPGELLPNAVLVEDPDIIIAPSSSGRSESKNNAETVPSTAPAGAALSPLELPFLASTASAESVLDAATVMEVSFRAHKGDTSSTNSIAITEVPMNTKASADLTRIPSMPLGSHSTGGESPTVSSESQYATPFSFSPAHTSRNTIVEPKKSFWSTGAASSSGFGWGGSSSGIQQLNASAASYRPPGSYQPQQHPSSPTKPATTTGASTSCAAALDDNWRVKKTVPSSASVPLPTATTTAGSSSSGAGVGEWRTGARPAWGTSSSSLSGTAATSTPAARPVVAAPSSAGTTSWSSVLGKGATAAASAGAGLGVKPPASATPPPSLATAATAAVKVGPVASAPKTAGPAADEWVTLSSTKKKVTKKM